jgi:predicted DNA-binding transcriptional regulator AlpA
MNGEQAPFIRMTEMRRLLGDVSRPFVDRLEKTDSSFPRRIRLGGIIVWPLDAVYAWMNARAGRVETR